MHLFYHDSIVLDQERWPRKPFCSDDPKKYGVRIRTFEHAKKRRLLQPNLPELVFRMVFDVDRPRQQEPFFSWELAGLPPPNWIAQNPENGHCHLSYEMGYPVSLSEGSRSRHYLSAVESTYGTALKADPNYPGNLVKNPSNKYWMSFSLRDDPYTLDELADWVEIPKKIRSAKVDGDIFCLGRNCAVFEIARKQAYEIVCQFWKPGGYDDFRKSVFDIVEITWDRIRNHDAWTKKTHPYRLHEIKNTADSIAKWTWKHFSPIKLAEIIEKTHSPELQAKRGKKGGQRRREKSDEEFEAAIRRIRLRFNAFEF